MSCVALVLVVWAAPAFASGSARDKPLDRRLLVIGDSVLLGAQDALVARLGATGWQVTPVLAESLHTYDAPALVDANAAAIGDVVVVGLGTNDGQTPGQFAGWIDDLMGHLRTQRRVYWVNLPQFAEWVPAANAEIDAARTRWKNLRVIDWGTRAATDPGLRYADGIHLTSAGQAAMADLVGATLDQLAGVAPPGTASVPPTTSAPSTAPPTTVPTTRPAPRTTTDREGGADLLAVVGLSAAGAVGIGFLASRRPGDRAVAMHPAGAGRPHGLPSGAGARVRLVSVVPDPWTAEVRRRRRVFARATGCGGDDDEPTS